MKDKYLVTGGAGFIGSNIVERLVAMDKDVVVLDNLLTGREDNLEGVRDKITFIEGDIRDQADVERSLEEVNYVIHQAALPSVARSIDDPLTTNDINVTGTLNLLNLSKKAGVKRLVYASSSSVYGNCEVFPQKEDMLTIPISPYAVSKLTVEYYARMFSATMGLETVGLRYFNVFGPKQDPASKYAAVIPIFISLLLDDKPCTINGDGKQARDFTYIDNVVDANLASCTSDGASGRVFNVACGKSYSVLDLAENLKKILGKNIENVHGPERAGDIRKSYADVTGLRKILNLETGVQFYEGLERTVEWFLNNRR